MRARHGEIPAVMLAADRDSEWRQHVHDAGMVVLYKPLKPVALRRVLQRATSVAQNR